MPGPASDASQSLAAIRSHARLGRMMVYAYDLLLVAVVVTAGWSIYMWSWWALAISVLVIGVAGKLTAGLRPRLVAASQRAQGAWLLRCAYGDERPPILLLRSFRSGTAIEPSPTVRVFGREQLLNDATSPAAAKSFVLEIASNLRKLGPVVAIGFSQRGQTASPALNVLFLSPSDEKWFELFEVLSSSCRAIVMLPGETASVVREYLSLRERGLNAKLLMLMPPQGLSVRWMPWVNEHREDLENAWKETAARFASENVRLPAYDPRGLAFVIDDNGDVTKTFPLDGYLLRLERAIEALIPDRAPGVRPMGDLMRSLARFDLPELHE